MVLTVTILDHHVNNVNRFRYLGIFISPDFTWTNHVKYIAGKINQRLGLLNRIKHLQPLSARLLRCYADLVALMSDLQVLQNKTAKIIIDTGSPSALCLGSGFRDHLVGI